MRSTCVLVIITVMLCLNLPVTAESGDVLAVGELQVPVHGLLENLQQLNRDIDILLADPAILRVDSGFSSLENTREQLQACLQRWGAGDRMPPDLPARLLPELTRFSLILRSESDIIARDNGFNSFQAYIDQRQTRNRVPSGTAEISGVVTGAGTGTPVSGIQVTLMDHCGASVDVAVTNALGEYGFTALDEEFYRMRLIPDPDIHNYYQVYHNGSLTYQEADPFYITDGSATVMNMEIPRAGWISGRFTDDMLNPVESIRIAAYSVQLQAGNSTRTDAAGNYMIRGLPASDCIVYSRDTSATPHYPEVGYPGGCSALESIPFHVSISGVSNIDFAVRPDVYMFGYAVDRDTGDPLADISLTLFTDRGFSVGYASSAFDGRYVFSAVYPGRYSVEAYSYDEWVAMQYDGHYTNRLRDLITVSPSDTIVGPISFELFQGGEICGRVTERDSGLGAEAIVVVIKDRNLETYSYAYTEGDGTYSAGALPPGTYYIGTDTFNYQNAFYNGKMRWEDADPVVVTGSETVCGIDMVLENAGNGAIAGRVFDEAGRILCSSEVNVYDSHGIFLKYEFTDTDGSYQIENLSAGDYYIAAANTMEGYARQYWGGSGTLLESDPVHVTDYSVSGNIDFYMHPGSKIVVNSAEFGSGYVFNSVTLMYSPRWRLYSQPLYSWLGTIAIHGIAAGQYYILSVDMMDHHLRWYHPEGHCRDTAQLVTIDGISNYSFNYYPLSTARVFGRVSDAGSGLGINFPAEIFVLDTTGTRLHQETVSCSGEYEVVVPANQSVFIKVESPFYGDMFYGQSRTISGATPVDLAPFEHMDTVNISVPGNPVSILLAESPLVAGDRLTADLFLYDPDGSDRAIDLYMAMQIGTEFYFLELGAGAAWTVTQSPVGLSFTMPAGLNVGPIPLFDIPLDPGSSLPELEIVWYAAAIDRNSGQIWGDLYMDEMTLWPSP